MKDIPLHGEMKSKLKEHLEIVKDEVNRLVSELDEDRECILCDFEDIQKKFVKIHSSAAYYYLQAYLTPFTSMHTELSRVAQHLSNRHHGALIAIQRDDSVDPLIKEGTALNAQFSTTLLESIFYPGNPLHDGAVLIKTNHIISAGNVLPISTNELKGANKKLGMRHRAAIGLSERSDALVLVVSEETGRISFAIGGKLYPVTTEELFL
ncbi:sporulation-specific diadenylate cyclase CdaS [Pseudalkalibacillus caeni]|uniref:Diadenylate cyclase n=1 Tax=Exobacillus caeni TaxID=2574798 RepID=A0A5R9F302_9BACL|nr:sporulation-specific diadenylate cyclase CdaS [Pseudalkalibacillus caeni]TLS37967.1 diadenylate cyclase [Pseudalkalibacillus caeni]